MYQHVIFMYTFTVYGANNMIQCRILSENFKIEAQSNIPKETKVHYTILIIGINIKLSKQQML